MERSRRNAKTEATATERFATIVAEIHITLAAIQAQADEHFGRTPDEIHWGHVGDAGRVRDALVEVLAIIRGENQ
jgi:hypothetical protein